jgi:ATP-binding cassette subfamily F protein uup
MPAPLFALRDVHLALAGIELLTGADLVVEEGARLCLVGRNGSGKSSFLKIAAGILEADRGERTIRGGARLRYLAQEPDLSGFPTVRSYVDAGLDGADDPFRVPTLLADFGLTGDEVTATLSGGELRRAALVRALAPDPDVLLLDEPTNHLDLPTIELLEEMLSSIRSALVVVSHDRRFLERLSKATIWLDRGRCRRLDRGFDAFEAWRDSVLAEEERDAHKLKRRIAAEEHWLRYGVTARRKRNERRLAELRDLRRRYRERRQPAGEVAFATTEAELSGKLVIDAQAVSKTYGDRAVVRAFSTRIARGDRVGLVGANGAGKTTLLRILTGDIAPDSGTVRLGSNLTIVTLDQKREALDPSWTLREALTRGGDMVAVGGTARHVVSYMKDFLFTAEQVESPVSVLSGGERGRLMLARALSQPANLLVLDEPTNDLDLETLDLLEEMLAEHPGTVLVVSHDRDFLDRVCTSIIVAEGDGRFVSYAGGYTDMVAQRGAGIAARVVARRNHEAVERRHAVASKVPEAPRFTSQDRRALDAMAQRIEQLEASAKRLRTIISDPGLYERDPTAFARASATLVQVEAALAAAEDKWLALDERRTAAGSDGS